jgi:hypothetical protein
MSHAPCISLPVAASKAQLNEWKWQVQQGFKPCCTQCMSAAGNPELLKAHHHYYYCKRQAYYPHSSYVYKSKEIPQNFSLAS